MFGSRCVGELLGAASGDWFAKTGSLLASECRNARWPHLRNRVDQVALLGRRNSASRLVRQVRSLLVYSMDGRGPKGEDGRVETAKTEIFGNLPRVISTSGGYAPSSSDRIGSRKGSVDSSRGAGVSCEERTSKSCIAAELSRLQVSTNTRKTAKTVFGRTFERVGRFS